MRAKKPRIAYIPPPSETVEQCALIEWTRYKGYPYNELYSNPNGGMRHKKTAGVMKAEGVRPGVSDMFLPVATNRFHGLYIELKRRRTATRKSPSSISQDQIDFHQSVVSRGYCSVFAFGWDQAQETLEWYIKEAIRDEKV